MRTTIIDVKFDKESKSGLRIRVPFKEMYKIFILIIVCKRWQSVSKTSWHDLKSLKVSPKTWGLKKNIVGEDFKDIFEKLLRRCGRFLTHLDLDRCMDGLYDIEMRSQIINMVTTECPNVLDFEMSHSIRHENDLEIIEPIFKKFKKFCIRWPDNHYIRYEELKTLFRCNTKLEWLEIDRENYWGLKLDVLYSVPCETLKVLKLHNLYESQIESLSVSMHFFYFNL